MVVESLGALAHDFYFNQKLNLRLDLPTQREPVLELFDRVRREFPAMDRFRRYDEEVALESAEQQGAYTWVAVGGTTLRSGVVNPKPEADVGQLHRMLLTHAPYFLSISALDIESVELMLGIDLDAKCNRNEVVFDALYGDGPIRELLGRDHEPVIDIQPFLGFALDPSCERQAFLEIKTRSRAAEIASGNWEKEPISVYLTVRQYGAVNALEELPARQQSLHDDVIRLAEERVMPYVVQPLREALLGAG